MNAILQLFITISQFFGLIQKTISAADHAVSMLDETAATAHKELTLNNADRIDALNARLAKRSTKRTVK